MNRKGQIQYVHLLLNEHFLYQLELLLLILRERVGRTGRKEGGGEEEWEEEVERVHWEASSAQQVAFSLSLSTSSSLPFVFALL